MRDFELARGYTVMGQYITYLDKIAIDAFKSPQDADKQKITSGDSTNENKDSQPDQEKRIEADRNEDDQQLDLAMMVIEHLGEFVWVGPQPLDLPEQDLLVYSPYNEGNLPPPASASGDKGKEGCIRNIEAFKLLQDFILSVLLSYSLYSNYLLLTVSITFREKTPSYVCVPLMRFKQLSQRVLLTGGSYSPYGHWHPFLKRWIAWISCCNKHYCICWST